jgi:hypothetical protein
MSRSKIDIRPITGEVQIERNSRDSEIVSVRFGTHMIAVSNDEAANGVELIFNTSDDLNDWIDMLDKSKLNYDRREANRPANVIRRAMQGTFRDQEARVEAILRDLVTTGHLDIEYLKDVER